MSGQPRTRAAAARGAMHRYIRSRQMMDSWWNPSFLLGLAVFDAIELRDLDGAADDLCCWLGEFAGDQIEGDHAALANAKTVINAGRAFRAALGGEGPEPGCRAERRVVEGAQALPTTRSFQRLLRSGQPVLPSRARLTRTRARCWR